MNYGGVVLIGIGGVALIFGIRGTYKSAWQSITKSGNAKALPTSTNSSGISVMGASGDFNGASFGSGSAAQYAQIAYNDAQKAGINATYFVKQINAESGFNPFSFSPAGAIGIAQFMPNTAASLGIDPNNAEQSLSGAASLMKSLIAQFGSEAKALAAYNAGPATVDTAVANYGANWWQDIPAETQNYIQKITGSYYV